MTGTGIEVHGLSNMSYGVVFDGITSNVTAGGGVLYAAFGESLGNHTLELSVLEGDNGTMFLFDEAVVISQADSRFALNLSLSPQPTSFCGIAQVVLLHKKSATRMFLNYDTQMVGRTTRCEAFLRQT